MDHCFATIVQGSFSQSKVPTRGEVALSDQWNVEAMYKNIQEWEGDFQKYFPNEKPLWAKLMSFQGRLSEGAQVVRDCLVEFFLISRGLSRLYTYAHLRHDEDIASAQEKVIQERALHALYTFHEKTSWLNPEILSQNPNYLQKLIQAEELAEYRIFLEALIRLKPHTLSKEEEGVLSLTAQTLSAPRKIYTALTNADLKFSPALDCQGASHEVTISRYNALIKNPDRKLRENAFKSMHEGFMSYENTLCELLHAQAQTHLFDAKARRYNDCLTAALFPYQIDPAVYRNLIKTVKERVSVLHRYIRFRKNTLKVEVLEPYDLYISLIPAVDMKIPYPEAEKLVIHAAGFLGKNYQQLLQKGLLEERWVDRYPNQRKRTGAYSSGCYDSMPYILMNYQATLSDAMTLCHEAGHSMHTLLSKTTQPYHYADYPIFVAEVASTFAEEVMMRQMIKEAKSPEHKAYLIHQKIEDIRATLFRQTLFAEFELLIHTLVEQAVPLTPKLLKEEYHRLNQEYYGCDLNVHPLLDVEWARIPHFYSNFYVYQYATGISAAIALVDRIENSKDAASREIAKGDYLKFLCSGSSKFPVELLEIAGVDMKKSDAISDTINYFEKLISELEGLLA